MNVHFHFFISFISFKVIKVLSKFKEFFNDLVCLYFVFRYWFILNRSHYKLRYQYLFFYVHFLLMANHRQKVFGVMDQIVFPRILIYFKLLLNCLLMISILNLLNLLFNLQFHVPDIRVLPSIIDKPVPLQSYYWKVSLCFYWIIRCEFYDLVCYWFCARH
jgi:hypothetical protein